MVINGNLNKMVELIIQETKPKHIQQLGDGTYYYNYNIKPTKIVRTLEDKEETIDGWEFVQAYIEGLPNEKASIKAIIRKYVTLEEEFDLINSYNKAIINNDTDSLDVLKYKEYLEIVDNIKKEIKGVYEGNLTAY